MNAETANILADAIDSDFQRQTDGKLFEVSDDWDEIYGRILPIEEDFAHPTYSTAMRFWESRGDAVCHD